MRDTSIYDGLSSSSSLGKGVPVISGKAFEQFSLADLNQTIAARFEEQVCRYADRIAIRERGTSWTYAELNRRANQIANTLLTLRGLGQEPVPLLLDKSALGVAALLGVLKAGKIYVPLATSSPLARNSQIVDDAGPALILTENRHAAAARQLAGGERHVINLNDLPADRADSNPRLALTPDNYAYIIYTSGSTGQPKGVVETHRNLLQNIRRFTNHTRLGPDDRLAGLNAWSFSNLLKDIYGALLNGGTFCPLDLEREGLVDIASWLVENEITVLSIVATVFRHLTTTLNGCERFPHLRAVRLGSEAVNRHDFELFCQHFVPPCVLINGYGTTESGTARLCVLNHRTHVEDHVLPVGYAVDDSDVLLLDEAGQEVACGEIGEIAIRSDYLSPGYWKRPDLTGRAFLPDPEGSSRRLYRTGDLGVLRPDGCLCYAGRKDFQVKVRGHRIEVAEVELALLACPGVAEAVVVSRDDQPEDRRLVGYVIPKCGSSVLPSELRTKLKGQLPDYAVPSVIVLLDALPQTTTGKLDRRALPPPGQERPAAARPCIPAATNLETQLLEIWEELLDVHPLSVDDNFFELGGNSLLAAQLFIRINEKFGKKLPLGVLFEAATVAQLAYRIAVATEPSRWPSLVPVQPHGTRPPFYCVHALGGGVLTFERLARHLGDEQPFYAIQAVDAGEDPRTRVEDLAARYVEELLAFQSSGPYYLGGWSFGGAVAFEMAQQLRHMGHTVAFLAIIDQRRPNLPRRPARDVATLVTTLANLPRFLYAKLQDETLSIVFARQVTRLASILRGLGRRFGQSPNEPERAASAGHLQHLAFVEERYKALRRYEPQVYDGPLTLFRTKLQPILQWHEPRMGWSQLVTDIRMIHIAGDHYSALREPRVADLARQLRTCLTQAQELFLPVRARETKPATTKQVARPVVESALVGSTAR